MGVLTRANLRAEVESNLGGRTNTTRIDRQLHLAQIRIARAWNWQELVVREDRTITVTGVASADKRSTTLSAINVREILALGHSIDTTPVKLISLPQRQWDQMINQPDKLVTTAGNPTHYMAYGGAGGTILEWFPVKTVGNWTLHCQYTVWPTDFANDSAVSALDNKDDIILAACTSALFHSLGMADDGGRWFGVYRDMLRGAMEEDSYKPDVSLAPRRISEQDHGVVGDPVADPFVKRIES